MNGRKYHKKSSLSTDLHWFVFDYPRLLKGLISSDSHWTLDSFEVLMRSKWSLPLIKFFHFYWFALDRTISNGSQQWVTAEGHLYRGNIRQSSSRYCPSLLSSATIITTLISPTEDWGQGMEGGSSSVELSGTSQHHTSPPPGETFHQNLFPSRKS